MQEGGLQEKQAPYLAAAYLVGADALKSTLPSVEDYDVVRADYKNRLFDAMIGYVSSAGGSQKWANQIRKAIVDNFPGAFYSGYSEAGGEDTENEDEAWLTRRVSEELSYVPGLFEELKAARDAETVTEPAIRDRVDNWAASLAGVYAEGKLRGDRNKMLTFEGEDGTKSCITCQKYKGKRHSAKWWLGRDLVRRPNEGYECGRFDNCQHEFYTDDGEQYT